MPLPDLPSRALTWPAIGRIVGAIALAFGAATVSAQLAPDSGSTLRQLETPSVTLPAKPPPMPAVVAPPSAAAAAAPGVRFSLRGVRITGATAISETELQALLAPAIGREVDFAALEAMAASLTRLYAQRGYPLATAYLPAQDIQDGVVQIVVLEGRFGKVELRNRSLVKDSVVTRFLQDLPGRIVSDALLERALLLVYDLPGVAPAQAVLSPGSTVGETDLAIEIAASRAVTGSVELDNQGGRFTGANRVSGRIEVLSPAGLGDQFSVRLIKGDPGLTYTRIGYQLPLAGNGMVVGVDYSRADYRLGKDFSALGASGDAATWSLQASYPLLRSRDFNLVGRVGIERKEFQDRVAATALVNDKSSRVATLALNGDFVDNVGGGAANAFSVTWTGGDMNIETPAARAIDAASARTDGSFGKLNLSVLRSQSLGGPWSAWLSFSGQKASANLDSSEKFTLGGAGGVRAYPQGEAPGDSGYLLTGELRYRIDADTVPGALELAGFVDVGSVKLNEEPFIVGANHRHLSGGGLGLNWRVPGDVTLRLSLARRLGSAAATAGKDSKTRGWLQLTKRF